MSAAGGTPYDPTDDPKKICFSVCLWGLPLGRESESNPPCDPTDDPKELLFRVSLGIANGKRVGEQPSLGPY